MTSDTCVVVGANRGIGLELTRQLSARGDRVVATARDLASATSLAESGCDTVLPLDITDQRSVDAFGLALAAEVDSVDLLINNAGVNAGALGHEGPAGVLDISGSTMLAVTEVNAVGPVLVLRAVLPLLEAAGEAWVVNISSQLGSMEVGLKMGGNVAYNVSKAALNMITVCAARELVSRGVRSAAFHPGWVRTDMGGTSAPLAVKESASGIISRIDTFSPNDNGGFFRWVGSTHPW